MRTDILQISPNRTLGTPNGRLVIIHATRSGVSMNPREFEGTIRYFSNPSSQVSAHLVIARDKRIARTVPDNALAWHDAVKLPDGSVIENNTRAWGIELEQGVSSDGFTDAQMRSLVEAGRHYIVLGVEPRHVTNVNQSGFIGHEETDAGRISGKSDPGSKFDWTAFIDALEDDMKLLFYRFGKTIYAIGPDAKARRISGEEWAAHSAAGATFIQVDKDPSKIASA